MKFLKTFLFTISLTFISFGVVSVKGFCASVAVPYGMDSTSLSIFQGQNNILDNYGMSRNGQQILHNGSLSDVLGLLPYDDPNAGVFDIITDPNFYTNSDVNSFAMNNANNVMTGTPLDPNIANSVANRMAVNIVIGSVTAKSLFDNGYQYFSTKVKQWGDNVNQWVLGKYDDVTGKISQVGSNVVTKITAQGLANYYSLYHNAVNDNIIQNLTLGNSFYGDRFSGTLARSSYGVYNSKFYLHFPDNVYLYTSGRSTYGYYMKLVMPITDLDLSQQYCYLDLDTDSFFTYSDRTYNNLTLRFNSSDLISSEFTLNGVTYSNCNFVLCDTFYNVIDVTGNGTYYFNTYTFGNFDNVKSLIQNNLSPSIVISLDYSSGAVSQIQDALDRLIGKYVDSISLKRINDLIDSIPIGYENVDGIDVPVAIPDSAILDAIDSAIDDAIDVSEDYAQVFEYADEITADPEPDPIPDYTGTAVPENFPDAIFNPITDSVGGMFDIVSIFEPLFYIFSFSAGLLGLWLVVPFVILFLILFRLLK